MSDSKDSKRPDVFQRVTDQLIKALEAGEVPWRKPWTTYGPHRNVLTGRAYNGVNPLLLQLIARHRGYEYPLWLTFRQAQQVGGHVRKGERGVEVVFCKRKVVEDPARPVGADETAEGERKTRTRFIWRAFYLFNIAQVEGVAFAVPKSQRQNSPIEAAEALWASYQNPPRVIHQGDRAFYRPNLDLITLPKRDLFESSQAYYETLFHEGIHSTGAEHRLDRNLSEMGSFGDPVYSHEELVAEIGACLLMARAGLQPDIKNSAAYLQGWLRRLRNDKRLVVMAASQAEKAALHIAPLPQEVSAQAEEALKEAAA